MVRGDGHKHREGAAIDYHAGMDVSLEETTICIVDETGAIVKEMRAASEPEALVHALSAVGLALERIGLEACSLTAWLHDGLRATGWLALCIQTQQANAAMKTMPNKIDRNDACALAQIMRTGWFRQVHVTPRQSRLWRLLLVARRTVLNEMRSIENVVRAGLREAGQQLGRPARARFDDRVRAIAGNDEAVMAILAPLLAVLRTMREQFNDLTRQVLAIVREEVTCSRLMTVPGVGPIPLRVPNAATRVADVVNQIGAPRPRENGGGRNGHSSGGLIPLRGAQ